MKDWKAIFGAMALFGVLAALYGASGAESLDAAASQTIPTDTTPTVEIATKDFVRAEINAVRLEIRETETRLIKWMVGTAISIALVVIGAAGGTVSLIRLWFNSGRTKSSRSSQSQ